MSAFYQGTTTVGMYESLGPEAITYILDQTKLATVFVSSDYISIYIDMKEKDNGHKLNHLKFLVSFESDLPEGSKERAA